MSKWVCSVCGYVYKPEKGIENQEVQPGTAFDDLTTDFTCPVCGMAKNMFEVVTE